SSLGNVGEARKEVVPTLAVTGDRFLRESSMNETQERPRSHRLEVDLDCARSGRDRLVTFPAPGEHDATITNDLDVFAGRDVLCAWELDAERTVAPRLEL